MRPIPEQRERERERETERRTLIIGCFMKDVGNGTPGPIHRCMNVCIPTRSNRKKQGIQISNN